MKWLLLIPAMLLMLVVWAAGAMWATLPERHGVVAVPGLSGPVSVRFDRDGVPWIAAGSDVDAAAALGAVHARARMFQMELTRRAGSGRLSEWAGGATYMLDATARTLGLRRRAEEDFPHLPAHTRAMLEAYARGVNAEIVARGRYIAPEFLVLGTPEPWTAVDSLLWGKSMAQYLSGNYRAELARQALARRVRPEVIQAIWPGVPAALPASAGLAGVAGRLAAMLPAFPAPFTLPRMASDEWAVDGAHSATGAPLLAGDPHLAFGMPGFWFLARIDIPGQSWAGATAPGMPFVVLGRNAHIGWTFTTTDADTQDLFIETPVDAGHYLTPTGPASYVVHDETIHVRGGADRVLHVRETRHGPVISDIDAGGQAGQVLSVAMAALQPGDTAAAGLDALDRAGSVAEAMRAAPVISAPVQNLLVADRANIGFATTGMVPLRRSGNGMEPEDGATGAFDWTGFASGAQLPHFLNPASGHLLNGNEPAVGADFAVFMGGEPIADWRARRMRALLGGMMRAKVADFVAMQGDVRDPEAAALLPVLLAVQPQTVAGKRGLALLQAWDGAMGREVPQPLVYDAWMQRFWLEVLDRVDVPASLAGGRTELLDAVLLRGEHADLLCGSGGCGAALASALDQAMADMAPRYGADPALWRWGRAHRAVFAHPLLGRLPLVGRLFSWSIAAPGGDETLDRGAMAEGPVLDFTDLHGAAFRAVYDLADLDRSRFVLAPGQSGNVFSANVASFMQRWRDGGTVTLGADPPNVSGTLALQPGQ